MRLLLLSCGDPDPYIAEHHGAYRDWFRAAIDPAVELTTFDPREHTAHESAALAVLDGVDGVIISGSPHSVYEPLPWIALAERVVREAVTARELPVLGVCFGHQLIAQAFGGRVALNPRGREIGTVVVECNDAGRASALLGVLPARFDVQATHCDTVVEPPPGARVLASSLLDSCQAFELGSAYGVQFHPEITDAIIRAYLVARRARLADERLDVDALLAGVRAADAGRQLLARFVGLVRARVRGERGVFAPTTPPPVADATTRIAALDVA